MKPMILQNGVRLVVFNEEATRRLAAANDAIRRVRNRSGLPQINAVYIDSPRPLVLLQSAPDEYLLESANGPHSHRLGDGNYQIRCTAFGVDWGWIAAMPAISMPRAA